MHNFNSSHFDVKNERNEYCVDIFNNCQKVINID